MLLKNLILYRQTEEGIDCPDAIAAAWIADRYLRDRSECLEILGCSYQAAAPDVSNSDRIFVLNFSVPRSVVDSWVAADKRVIIIDHHRASQEMLGKISRFSERFEFNFDSSESGASLVWKYFKSGWVMPAFLQYVRDRALQQHLLPMTDEIHEASANIQLEMVKTSGATGIPARTLVFAAFDHLSTLSQPQLISFMGGRGSELLKLNRKAINWAVARLMYGFLPHTDRCQICNTPIPMVYLLSDGSENRLISGICTKLYNAVPEAPFVACVTAEGVWSLHSDKDGSDVDVSVIARIYGGGGLRNEAKFKT